MTTLAMKERIKAYLDKADDSQIEHLYAIVQTDKGQSFSADLTNEQMDFLDKERAKYLNGEGKSYDWERVKEMIRKRKAS